MGGDYKFDPLGFGGGPDLAEKELSNGRLAMMAFSGIVTQSVLTGGGFPYTSTARSTSCPRSPRSTRLRRSAFARRASSMAANRSCALWRDEGLKARVGSHRENARCAPWRAR